MKIKLKNLTHKEKEAVRNFYDALKIQNPLMHSNLTETLAVLRKRFPKPSKECNSISSEFFSKPLQILLADAAEDINERIEILTSLIKICADEEFIVWDELCYGSFLLHLIVVHRAYVLFVKIIDLLTDTKLKTVALLSLCFQLGKTIESFRSVSLMNLAKAKLYLLDKERLGGERTAKLNLPEIIELSVWAERLAPSYIKKKDLYKALKAKWIKKYPERSISERTIQHYLLS